jgi:hypothetical protein
LVELPKPVRLRREPTVAAFEERRLVLRERGLSSVHRVQELSEAQLDLGTSLRQDLAGLTDRGSAIEQLQQDANAGVLAGLVRRLTARRDALARRSATAALVEKYEAVQTALRRATALADDLRVCAVELQGAVDDLHGTQSEAEIDAVQVATRILALEADLVNPVSAQVRDRLHFELANESTRLELLEGMAELSREQLGPARRLRDTVQRLHAQTAKYVLNAAGTVNEAGRSIQALGVAADAPLVVLELQQALAALNASMAGGDDVMELAQDLVANVLPDLDAQLSAADETRRWVDKGAGGLNVAQTKLQAERALRRAARAEVDALGS